MQDYFKIIEFDFLLNGKSKIKKNHHEHHSSSSFNIIIIV